MGDQRPFRVFAKNHKFFGSQAMITTQIGGLSSNLLNCIYAHFTEENITFRSRKSFSLSTPQIYHDFFSDPKFSRDEDVQEGTG